MTNKSDHDRGNERAPKIAEAQAAYAPDVSAAFNNVVAKVIEISGEYISLEIPTQTLAGLDLQTGDEVTLHIVDTEFTRQQKTEVFLSLEGIFADCPEFDEAVEYLEQESASNTIYPSSH